MTNCQITEIEVEISCHNESGRKVIARNCFFGYEFARGVEDCGT